MSDQGHLSQSPKQWLSNGDNGASEMIDQALKACPFCGGEGFICRENDIDGFGIFAFVKCHSCRAQSASVFFEKGNDCPLTYQQVCDYWNGRLEEQVK